MHSTIAIDVAAPPELVFDLARDSSAGSGCSPTTRARGRVERRADGAVVVDFVARRPFRSSASSGSGCRWPGASRTWNEPATRRLRFVARRRGHAAGWT